MIPSTFTLTGARTVTYDDGVRALILTGEQHTKDICLNDPSAYTVPALGLCPVNRSVRCDFCQGDTTRNVVTPVSVTVFLGRDGTWAEAITRALTEGDTR